MRARGVSPYRSTAAALATTRAAAPSDSGDDEPGGDDAVLRGRPVRSAPSFSRVRASARALVAGHLDRP